VPPMAVAMVLLASCLHDPLRCHGPKSRGVVVPQPQWADRCDLKASEDKHHQRGNCIGRARSLVGLPEVCVSHVQSAFRNSVLDKWKWCPWQCSWRCLSSLS
jgi:hypothetical protein